MKVLVTGSSSGIGEAVAKRFLEKGHEVVGIDILPSSFSHPCYRHYTTSITRENLPDLSDLDILINNAGVQDSEDDIDVNLKGTINLTEFYLKRNVFKSILFITSASAHSGAEFEYYSASKGGLLSYCKNVARRVSHFGTTCNSLSPGGVLTSLNSPVISSTELWGNIMSITPLKKWMTVEECAEWCYFLTVKNKSCTGVDILVDNGENTIPTSTEFVWV